MNKKVVISIIGVVILVTICSIGGYFVGNITTKHNIEGKTYTLASIDNEIESKREENNSLSIEVKDNEDNLNKISQEYSHAKEVIEEKDSTIEAVQVLKEDRESLNEEIEMLSTKISENENKLKKLEEGVALKEAEPRTLIAGNFVVGKDIDPGRYKVYPTNKFEGDLIINDYIETIFFSKDESYGVEEYVLSVEDGDEIKASIPLTFAPVE